MDNLIRVYDDVIDEDSCKMLIDKFEKSSYDYEEVNHLDDKEVISFKQINLHDNADWNSIENGMLDVFQDYIMN